jgi:aerobic carbon-monoxide dehydrogenase medium subunit
MKPAPFSYFRPSNVGEALEMIAGAGDDARFLAGGQSLVPMMNFRIARPAALVDLAACNDLVFVEFNSGQLRVGAMMRQRDAETNETIRQHCPLIAQALGHAGPLTIRNRATVGGTIANGYPVAELPVVAVCMDAEIVLIGRAGERRIPAIDFFTAGLVTAIEPGELVREIAFPVRGQRARYSFAECGNHTGGAALAIVSACAEAVGDGRLTSVSVAAAGLSSTPVRLRNIEVAVEKGSWNFRDAFAQDLAVIDKAGEDRESDANQRGLVLAVLEGAITSLRAPMGTAA